MTEYRIKQERPDVFVPQRLVSVLGWRDVKVLISGYDDDWWERQEFSTAKQASDFIEHHEAEIQREAQIKQDYPKFWEWPFKP